MLKMLSLGTDQPDPTHQWTDLTDRLTDQPITRRQCHSIQCDCVGGKIIFVQVMHGVSNSTDVGCSDICQYYLKQCTSLKKILL